MTDLQKKKGVLGARTNEVHTRQQWEEYGGQDDHDVDGKLAVNLPLRLQVDLRNENDEDGADHRDETARDLDVSEYFQELSSVDDVVDVGHHQRREVNDEDEDCRRQQEYCGVGEGKPTKCSL